MDLTTIENKLEIILKEVEALKSNINGNSVTYKEQPYESKETNELNEAIAKASLEFPKIKVNRQNPYLASGYSDLHEIMNKIRPIFREIRHPCSPTKKTYGRSKYANNQNMALFRSMDRV